MSSLRKLLLPAMVFVATAMLLDAQTGGGDFGAFYQKFTTAVLQQDTATLDTLMAPHFDFIFSTDVPHQAVFDGLAAEEGQQWDNLQQAVQGTPVPYAGGGPYRNSRVLSCTPNEVIYNCLVVFKKDGQGRWRWRAIVIATR